MDRADKRREAKAAQKAADARRKEAERKTKQAQKETWAILRQFKKEIAGVDQDYVDPTVAVVPPELLARMYPDASRPLTPAENAAIDAQAITARYPND
ncbi:MAG: hypothetical protein MUD11_07490 [Rhodobacteraceae bacterium]|jgi:hypothetical protein|nr:hypothetical protein [Paracoccaceae bacterium]